MTLLLVLSVVADREAHGVTLGCVLGKGAITIPEDVLHPVLLVPPRVPTTWVCQNGGLMTAHDCSLLAQKIGNFDLFRESYEEAEDKGAVGLYQNVTKGTLMLANVVINEEERAKVCRIPHVARRQADSCCSHQARLLPPHRISFARMPTGGHHHPKRCASSLG